MGVDNHKRCGCKVSGDTQGWFCETHNTHTTESLYSKHKSRRVNNHVTTSTMTMRLG